MHYQKIIINIEDSKFQSWKLQLKNKLKDYEIPTNLGIKSFMNCD